MPRIASSVFGQNGDVHDSHVPGFTLCTPAPSAAWLRRPLTIVMSALNGANGARICGSSNSRPVAAGVQRSMTAPCGR